MSPTPTIRSHPTESELAAYLGGSSTELDERRVEEHLRSGCLLCVLTVRDRIERESSRGRREHPTEPGHILGAPLESRVRHAERKALVVGVEAMVAPRLIAELMLRPPAGRREIVHGSRRYKLLGLSEALREESRQETRRDVARALELAELAAEVADCLSTGFYGACLVADARALAWAMVGNGHRVAGDFFAAERAFQTASNLLEQGTGNPTEIAEVQMLLASLRIDQARFQEAIRLLDQAATTYRELDLQKSQGKAITKMGRAAILAGAPARALELFDAGLELLDAEQNPELVLFAHHNAVIALLDSGAAAEAHAYQKSIGPLYESRPEDRSIQIQRRWLEGLILDGLGRTDEAVERLGEIRRLFVEEDRAYDTAQVTLDLAAVLLGAGETAQVQRLVREMYPVFRSQDVHRQAIAALVLFEQAVTTDAATVSLAREVGRYLARARRNPYLRFEPTAPSDC